MLYQAIGLAVLAGVLNAALSQMLFKQPDKPAERAGFQIIFSFTGFVVVWLVIFFYGLIDNDAFHVLSENSNLMLFGCANGFFGVINLITVFEAIRRGPISIIWPVAWLSAPLSGLIWFVFTRFKGFNEWHAVGMALFVVCLFLMGMSKKQKPDNEPDAGNKILPYFFFFVIIAMLGGVGANLVFKYALEKHSAFQKVIFIGSASMTACTGMVIYCLIKMRKIVFRTGRSFYAVLGGMCGFAQFLLLAYGIVKTDLATFLCIFAGVAISVTILLARIFQKEKVSKRMLLGIAAAILAIVSFTLAGNIKEKQ